MKLLSLTALTLFCLASTVGFAKHHLEEKPSFFASRTVTANATVEAINQQTREVTLRDDDGVSATFTAGPDARNLSQVEPGDQVLAEFYEEISVSVHDPDTVQLGSMNMSDATVAAEGEIPAGMVTNTFITTAEVEAINIEANTFTLRDIDDNVKQFTAQDPDNLKRSKVGDMVVIKIVTAVGVVVEKPE